MLRNVDLIKLQMRNMNTSRNYCDEGDEIVTHRISKCPNKNNAFHKCADFCFSTLVLYLFINYKLMYYKYHVYFII